MTYTLRRATSADEGTVTGLIADRATWLASRDVDQWGIKDPARTTAATISAGETWLLVSDDDQTAVGTLTMSTRPDRDFWQDNAPAMYLSKLATRLDSAGRGLGELLVHAAYIYSQRRQIHLLRWDVWRTNTRLQDYYRGLGAELIEIAEISGRNSGALFEFRNAGSPHVARAVFESQRLLTIESRYGAVARLEFESILSPTTPYTTGMGGSRDFEDFGPPPNHAYLLPGLRDGAGHPYLLDYVPGRSAVLHHDGEGWIADTEPVAGEVLHQLHAGWPYWLIGHRLHNGQEFVLIRGDLDADQVDQTPAAPPVTDLTLGLR